MEVVISMFNELLCDWVLYLYNMLLQDEERQFFHGGFKDVIGGLEMLYTSHPFLCLRGMYIR